MRFPIERTGFKVDVQPRKTKSPIMLNSPIKGSLCLSMTGSTRRTWASRAAGEPRTSSKSMLLQFLWDNEL